VIKKSLRILLLVLTINQRDGQQDRQTDRRTDTTRQHRPRLASLVKTAAATFSRFS